MALPQSIAVPDLALRQVDVAGSALPAAGAADGRFGQVLARAVESVVQPQQAAAAAVNEFAAGADGELHRTMLAVERADISLKFLVSMRNRALEAYREIMHMGG